jgi:uncharacterized protein YdeI (YjbR/CyaY-like superfamily)
VNIHCDVVDIPEELKAAAEAYAVSEYPENMEGDRGIAYLAFIAGAKWNESKKWREALQSMKPKRIE